MSAPHGLAPVRCAGGCGRGIDPGRSLCPVCTALAATRSPWRPRRPARQWIDARPIPVGITNHGSDN